MSSALEGYKTDNGAYPASDGNLLTNTPYSKYDGTTVVYRDNSRYLYQGLSGQTNLLDTHVAGVKAYMSFKVTQLGNSTAPAGTAATAGASSTYIQDPWGYAVGYSTGTLTGAATPVYPNNGNGSFDLWSTGGLLAAKANTTNWLQNW